MKWIEPGEDPNFACAASFQLGVEGKIFSKADKVDLSRRAKEEHADAVRKGVEMAIDSVFDRYSFPNGYRCRIETCFGSFKDSKDLQDALSALEILCQAGGNEDHQIMWCNPTNNAQVFTAIFDSLSAAFITSVTFAIPPAPSEPEVKP